VVVDCKFEPHIQPEYSAQEIHYGFGIDLRCNTVAGIE